MSNYMLDPAALDGLSIRMGVLTRKTQIGKTSGIHTIIPTLRKSIAPKP
jgi:hypothetical protein